VQQVLDVYLWFGMWYSLQINQHMLILINYSNRTKTNCNSNCNCGLSWICRCKASNYPPPTGVC